MTIDEVLKRSVAEVIDLPSIKKKLAQGKQLRVKLGIDPTSPNLHLGRSIPLLKMRDFQELGHKAVLIVGDFTGVIGDTSDKESERPMLSREEIENNKQTYFEQIGKIINLKEAELRYNSEWLEPLTYRDIGEHADQFSVADFIARDNIRRRLDEGKRVSLREVLYPLMQGYDSVAVEADIELGGVDQRFNLLAGRTLQSYFKQEPQAVIMTTFPLLGLDGRKMSSSWENTINFNTLPEEMYGRIMSMADNQLKIYFESCTRIPFEEIDSLLQGHPKDAKMRLAREIVTIYHGDKAAQEAQENFIETFSKKSIPKDIETIKAAKGTKISKLLISGGVVSSKTEWRRLVSNGAVSDMEKEEKLTDPEVELESSLTLRVGKHRFIRLESF